MAENPASQPAAAMAMPKNSRLTSEARACATTARPSTRTAAAVRSVASARPFDASLEEKTRTMFIGRRNHGSAFGVRKSGSKLPHSKGLPPPHGAPLIHDLRSIHDVVRVVHRGGEAGMVGDDAHARPDRRRGGGLDFSVLLRERCEAHRQWSQLQIADDAVAEVRIDVFSAPIFGKRE